MCVPPTTFWQMEKYKVFLLLDVILFSFKVSVSSYCLKRKFFEGSKKHISPGFLGTNNNNNNRINNNKKKNGKLKHCVGCTRFANPLRSSLAPSGFHFRPLRPGNKPEYPLRTFYREGGYYYTVVYYTVYAHYGGGR